MPNQAFQNAARTEIQRLRKSLDDLFLRAFDVEPGSELAGDLNRYLCIRISGLLEQALTALGRSACETSAFGVGQGFALSWLERGPNPSSRDTLRFVRRFSQKWGDELEALLADDERGARLNSLVGIRNDIAHGKNQGVSAAQAFGYYELVVEVIDWLLERLEPKPGVAPASPA